MMDNPKCSAKLQTMLSVLPSYTRFGVEALLPHKTLEPTDDFREVVDGRHAIDLAARQAVLQSYEPESKCVQFDDIKNLKGQHQCFRCSGRCWTKLCAWWFFPTGDARSGIGY